MFEKNGRLCQKLMQHVFYLCVVRSWTLMYIRRMLHGASLLSWQSMHYPCRAAPLSSRINLYTARLRLFWHPLFKKILYDDYFIFVKSLEDFISQSQPVGRDLIWILLENLKYFKNICWNAWIFKISGLYLRNIYHINGLSQFKINISPSYQYQ